MSFWQTREILKDKFDLIQINVGDMCNLTCSHCHVGASPKGVKNMDTNTAKKVIQKIDIKTIEFTGGTPEMNPNFEMFLKELHVVGKNLAVSVQFHHVMAA